MSSATHLVLLPTYNTGPRLRDVVAEALQHWQPVLVVVDGSTDGSAASLAELAHREPALHVLVLPRNGGKGAAVLAGAQWARARGFTHALVMDADGRWSRHQTIFATRARRSRLRAIEIAMVRARRILSDAVSIKGFLREG